MNDRFKFRIYDKGNEQYIDPEDMDCVCHLPNGCFTIATWDGIQGDMKYWADEDIVVEMSTGLKDKNGNLIYEGDIVKCDRDFDPDGRVNLTKEVIFTDGSFTLANLDPKNRDFCYINRFHNIEIIGNIHNQPEQKD